MKAKILIVDDHFVVREGLKLILETSDTYEVIGEAENGFEALRLVELQKPDVILMDLNMPDMSGLETIKELNKQNSNVPVIILTTYNEDELMIQGLSLGVKGYLLKDTGRENLFRTIESALRGETLLQSEITDRIFDYKKRTMVEQTILSQKELTVLQGVAQGDTSKKIALDMQIAERTVKAHLTNIYGKLRVSSRSQAVAVAIEQGILFN
ncbi:response regulator transcription factor [Priestia koreensis]|uniref:Chemotaxis protein CheY n=1 Tax=Priestia koreensis TaxID=284581 RepID=A0A0M0L5W9_9BACI|nr:response regulator transcription factor [Priestia koreensis]KOO46460.1 chemotaxis protein CheY [Priestia koreensis]MCM3006356.1 response regulator transcription factor [Priestia koreensis]